MAKKTFTSVALFTLLHSAAAHYYFPYLIVNGTVTPEFKYVRQKFLSVVSANKL